MNKFFNNISDFIRLFDFGESYEKTVSLTDRKVGFSTQRQYPKDIRFVPAKTKDDKPDTVAIIHVVYTHPSETKKQINPQKVPIFIRIGKFSRYRINHFDYNFEDDNCPTEESISIMKNSPNPVDLETDEYFFNHDKNIFFNEKGENYSGIQLLNNIYEEHCNTVHLIKGMKIQWKLRSKNWAINFLSFIIKLNAFILRHIFGRTIDNEKDAFAYITGYKKEDIKKLSTESLKIFDYKASKNVIVTFSFIILAFYVFNYFYPINSDFMTKLFDINLYLAAFVIFILWVMDDIIPRCLFNFINFAIKIRKWLYFKKIKT